MGESAYPSLKLWTGPKFLKLTKKYFCASQKKDAQYSEIDFLILEFSWCDSKSKNLKKKLMDTKIRFSILRNF